MRRRSIQPKSSRSYQPQQTPYSLYYSLYGPSDDYEEDFYHPFNYRSHYAKNIERTLKPHTWPDYDPVMMQNENRHQTHRQPHYLPVARVEVEDLKVRFSKEDAVRWVEVDKCTFSSENTTLDTRLKFPDLTLSGKVVLQPTGGKCNMVLRLRHAGIEFRTIPKKFKNLPGEESRRAAGASVKTDSRFVEPGFISVFAHSCEGPTGIKLRQNSKRRYVLADEQLPDASSQKPLPPQVLFDIRSEGYIPPNMQEQELDLSKTSSQESFDTQRDNFYRKNYRFKRSNPFRRGHKMLDTDRLNDEITFDDDILNISDDRLGDMAQTDSRDFADVFSSNTGTSGNTFSDHEEVNEAMRNELDKLFSVGVKGLLITYMQRALQPAIKETLMENMGYTISYG